MKRPATPSPQRAGLADLRPNVQIQCLHCGQSKPQAEATKFHAFHVCRECAAKVRAAKEKTK